MAELRFKDFFFETLDRERVRGWLIGQFWQFVIRRVTDSDFAYGKLFRWVGNSSRIHDLPSNASVCISIMSRIFILAVGKSDSCLKNYRKISRTPDYF